MGVDKACLPAWMARHARRKATNPPCCIGLRCCPPALGDSLQWLTALTRFIDVMLTQSVLSHYTGRNQFCNANSELLPDHIH